MRVTTPSIAELRHLTAEINFLAPASAKPTYLRHVSPHAAAQPATEKHAITIHDVRPLLVDLSLDVNGFVVIDAPVMTADPLDSAAIVAGYYPACVAAVKAYTGATRVHAFDHNVRNKELAAQPGSGISHPVRFAHNDYTERSAPQRVRDLFGAEADALLERRYLFVNLWRPLRQPVMDVPLAVCDAGSLAQTDFVATSLLYGEREGEVYSLRHNPAQRWCYVSHMRPDEAFLLKCFDSAEDGPARYTAHGAFRDPTAAPDVPSRMSIEVRTIAFY
jgi:hypothetical protein